MRTRAQCNEAHARHESGPLQRTTRVARAPSSFMSASNWGAMIVVGAPGAWELSFAIGPVAGRSSPYILFARFHVALACKQRTAVFDHLTAVRTAAPRSQSRSNLIVNASYLCRRAQHAGGVGLQHLAPRKRLIGIAPRHGWQAHARGHLGLRGICIRSEWLALHRQTAHVEPHGYPAGFARIQHDSAR